MRQIFQTEKGKEIWKTIFKKILSNKELTFSEQGLIQNALFNLDK